MPSICPADFCICVSYYLSFLDHKSELRGDTEMHFLTIWTFRPEHANSAIERFGETGAPPPEGVNMLARWHDVAGKRGFALSETDDPVAIAKWCHGWNDLLSFEIVPVINDEQLGAVLAG
jgi:hypothetical protein